ncbi:MAG: SUMF1/EgtB/PvdO family nonheme iron enzyme [Bacteroidales bacterium]|nr:SUMF1/EgtB/PvdO family nonheme iron enzyme [Bacteroidales bacterium]
MKTGNKFTFTCMALLLSSLMMANNITVSNISLADENTTDKYVMVQFDLNWENSWHTTSDPNNWDAAWVFVKYRVGTGDWQHALLNDDDHDAGTGTGATIEAGLRTPGTAFNLTTNPALGVFIYRSASGMGNFSITGTQLRWNYGANGVAEDDILDVKVFAIEMVYVPGGSFYVGSGADPNESRSFTQANNTSGATVPFQITSTPPTLQGNNAASSSGNLSSRGGMDITGTNTASLATGFPTGYSAFYCMKYEISQQQYVDFLNTLTRTQQNNRTETSLAAGTTSVSNRYVMSNSSTLQHRNGIRCDASIHTSDPISFYCDLNGNGTGGESNDGQWIACNFLSWMDGAAYSDWAGLRPMTELEFEKACRGTAAPVANEYAWGNTNATAATSIANPGAGNETSNTSGANAVFNIDNSLNGPMRVGVFAKSSTTRVQAGASYYGIMELSGNLWEQPVTVGNATGRAFKGLHGDGTVSLEGYANETTWPGLSNGEVTSDNGSGLRGGNWYWDLTMMRVSDRFYGPYNMDNDKQDLGFRAARSKIFSIGEKYGGGIICYIDATGLHGLIADTENLSAMAAWGCSGTYIPTGTAIGTGQANTTAIVNGCSTAGIAARICDDLVLNGYSDWFLPSLDELNQIYINRAAVGGFALTLYWSSSQHISTRAWCTQFNGGTNPSGLVNESKRFRAVRAF